MFSNVPEAAEYQVAYELPIPYNGVFRGATPVPYSVDRSATVAPGGFDRVAYYLELTDTAGATTWAYASMDPFTTNAAQLGLPHDTNNNVTFQRTVSNLSVLSNVSGVVTGAFDQGEIEFYHFDYTSGNTNPAVFGSGSGAFDWGDVVGGNSSGYGSFQVAVPSARQMVISYNHWAADSSTPDDVGIGNRPGTQHVDWTAAGNAGNYPARKLVVLVRPRQMNVTFTALPRNQQITPRNLSTNAAILPVAGAETAGGFDQAVLRVLRNGVPQGVDVTQALTYLNGSASFAFNPTIVAELASYTLEIYLRKGAASTLVRRVSDLAAGDVYLWYGQSNAEGSVFNGSANAYFTPWVRTFGLSADDATSTQIYNVWTQGNGDGSRYVEGGVGQWALVVGRKIVDAYRVPVAILNGARGGYAMPQLQPDDADPNNLADANGVYRVYNRLRYRAKDGGVAGAVRGIFFYEGEGDSNNTAQHTSGFANLVAAWQRDYPSVERIFVTQVHVGCGVERTLPSLRDAQRRYQDVYPRVRVMSTNGLISHTDDCHYPFIGGYENIGVNNFRLAARELYGAPALPDIEPPNPLRVELATPSGDRLRIVLRDPASAITIDPAALDDFRLNGSGAVLTSATVTGAGIELQYDRSVSGATGLDYLAHIGAGGGWVRNANGVGLLAFAEPLASSAPVVTLGSQTAEAVPGSSFALNATATTPVGTVARFEVWVDGLLYAAVNGASAVATTWPVPAAGAHKVLFRAYNSGGFSGDQSILIFAGSAAAAPGGVGAGLSVWLKPEKGVVRDAVGRVSQWADSSGNANGCVQPVDAQKPVIVPNYYGLLPGLSFNGANCLNGATGMSAGSYTKVVRATVSDLSVNDNILSSAGGTGNVMHALYMAQSPYPRLYQGSIFVNSSAAVAPSQSFVLIATYDSATKAGKLYLDGAMVGSGTASADPTNVTYQVGAHNYGSFLIGSVGEVMIYNRALSDAECAAVQTYLANRSALPPDAARLSYVKWAAANLPPSSDTTPAADANGNGISNLVEYALGLDQTTRALPEILEVQRAGDTLSVSYSHPTDRTGVAIQLQESADLAQWTVVPDAAGPAAGGIEQRVYSRPAGSAGKAFYRLAVSQIP